MLKRRLIPVLLLQHGWMVRSELFRTHQVIGNPVVHVERMVQWDVDELIVLDISAGAATDFGHNRDDYREPGATDLLAFIRKIAAECRIPLTFGGRIRSLDDMGLRIQNGADKVTLNTAALDDPELIRRGAETFGAQAVVVSIDYRHGSDGAVVFRDNGRVNTGRALADWARSAEDHGAGEILVNAIDRDGVANGYDLETIAAIADTVRIPVIACGGAGHMRHFAKCFESTDASAVAAANIFHFTENAYPRAKRYLRGERDDIR